MSKILFCESEIFSISVDFFSHACYNMHMMQKLFDRTKIVTYFVVVLSVFVLCISGALMCFGTPKTQKVFSEIDSVVENLDMEEYQSFSNRLKEMYKFDNLQSSAQTAQVCNEDAVQVGLDATQTSDAQTDENNRFANRLIVSFDGSVEDFGAIAKAEYSDWHIFQYQNAAEAETAYQNLKNSHIQVEYDRKVHTDAQMSSTYTQPKQFTGIKVADGAEDENEGKSGAESAETLQSLRTLSENQVQKVSTSTSAIYSHHSWGAEYVGYAEYSSTLLKLNGESVDNLNQIVVAVIDSGIYREHELFENRLLDETFARNFSDEYLANVDYDYIDKNGHGTHVSGTIAEGTLGNVKILPLKCLDKDGDGYVSAIVNAIEYVITLKISNRLDIRAINMSVGVTYDGSGSGQNNAVTNAVNKAYDVGVISVASAGNDCVDVKYSAPANVDKAFSISGLQKNASLSETPMTFAHSYSNYGEGIDFCAPATDVESSFIPVSDNGYNPNAYATFSGTSMASPHVTAAIALLLSDPANFNATPQDVYNILKEQALTYYDFGTPGKDNYYGWGCVNIGNYGIAHKGEVKIEKREIDGTTYLLLSYEQDPTAEIYYTTDDGALLVDEFSGELYTSMVPISQTSKITAVAYVYKNGVLVQKSFVSSKIFYFNDMDLSSNYQFAFRQNRQDVYLYAYVGLMEKVKIPDYVYAFVDDQLKRFPIIAVGYQAFAGTKVKEVLLSNNVIYLDDSCFRNNQQLQAVSGGSAVGVSVGSYAFYNCKNLTKLDLPNIRQVYNYCFSYDTNLTGRMDLENVDSVGRNAFSNCGISEILFGNHENLQISEQRDINLDTKILGYSNTEAQAFAYRNGLQFKDLTMRFVKDLNQKTSVLQGGSIETAVAFLGKNVSYDVYVRDAFERKNFAQVDVEEIFVDEFEKQLNISVSNLTESCFLEVCLQDGATLLYSYAMQIEVLAQNEENFVAKLSFAADVAQNDNKFKLLLDGQTVENGAIIYQNRPYVIEIDAADGYCVESVKINGVLYQNTKLDDKFVLEAQQFSDQNVNITVKIAEKMKLKVSFSALHGQVFVGDEAIICAVEVERNSNLIFTVKPDDGFEIDYVKVGDQRLIAQNGFYTIENITLDTVVEVNFRSGTYQLSILIGKGGTVSSTGVGVDSKLVYGETRTFDIATYEGYVLDYVMVNGAKIAIEDNHFVLENVNQDYEVLIMFKKIDNSVFGNRILMNYLIVFVSLFGVFLVAKVVLMLVRKRQNSLKK